MNTNKTTNTNKNTSKKVLSMYLSTMLLCSSLLLTGCGQSADTDAKSDKTPAASTDAAGASDTSNDADTNTNNDTDDEAGADAADVSSSAFDDVFAQMTTTDLDGNAVDASIFKDHQLTLVNAWNIGCTPCIQELPYLEQLSEEYADQGVGVMGLYFNFGEDIPDDEMSQIEDALSTANATYTQLRLTKEMYETDTMQNVMAFPSTFIVDSDGKIIDKLEGSNDFDGWKQTVEQYLQQIN